MRIHFLGFSHTITHPDYTGCAYTMKVRRACEGFTNAGDEVYHYGNPGADVACTQHIDVVDQNLCDKLLRKIKDNHQPIYEANNDEHDFTFYLAAAGEIRKRVRPGDYIMFNYNGYLIDMVMNNLLDLQHLPVFLMEMSVGYCGSYKAPYRVYESHCMQTWTKTEWQKNWDRHQEIHGEDNNVGWAENVCHNSNAQWTDDVIDAFIDEKQFDYTEHKDKEDYFLFLGRQIPAKGIDLAVKAAEAAGVRLVVAGQGDFEGAAGYKPPGHVDFIGYAGIEKRRELMSKALGGFVCTVYSEPCGHVIFEYGLSGTPVIATDWGALPKNVLSGQTGYVIRSHPEATDAVRAIKAGKIESWRCRKWCMNFTPKRIIPVYRYYMQRIAAANKVGKSETKWNHPLFYDHEVDLSVREKIYPDDPRYDMNLNRGTVGCPPGHKGTPGKPGKEEPDNDEPDLPYTQEGVKGTSMGTGTPGVQVEN